MNRLLLGLTFGLLLAVTTDVGSLSAQTLEGRVVHGVDSSAISGVMVELHQVTATAGAVVDSAVSSADGSFVFRLAQGAGSDALWLAAARHEGVLYFGPARHAGQPADEVYEVLVYDSVTVTAPPADLRVGMRHLVVTAGPSRGFDVAEVIDVLGSDHHTLVPVSDTLAIWASSVPASALGPRAIEGGVPPEAISFESDQVVLRSMISPLGARVTFVYSTRLPVLEIRIDHPTDRMEVVVAGLNAEVTGASPRESSLNGSQPVFRYTAENLLPGATIRVAVPELPGRGAEALIWALVGLGFLVAAGVLWTIGDRGSEQLRPPIDSR